MRQRKRETKAPLMTKLNYTILLVATVLAGSLLLRCSNPTIVEETATLTVTPTSGVPGTALKVSGLTGLDATTDTLSATIGGQSAPVIISDSGQVLVSIPLFLDDSGVVVVPTAKLDLVLSENGMTLGEAKGAITVEALPAPTHSLADLTSSLTTISATLDTVLSAFNSTPGIEEQYTQAILKALDSLINSADPSSLASGANQINADSSLAYVTAVLDANGIIEEFMNMAAELQATSSSLATTSVVNPLSLQRSASPTVIPTTLTDQDLARRMQFYVIVKMFGETVINETGQTFAETVGLAAGVIGISGTTVPYVAIVSAVLTLIDVVVNKIVVGALPATIDSMSVAFANNTISPGDTTEATVYILTSNLPAPLTAYDLVGLTMTAIGLTGSSTPVESFRDVLKNTVDFFLGIMQSTFAAYSTLHPELHLDINVATLTPPMKWEAYVNDPQLVKCQSLTPSIVTGMTSSPNWQADSVNYGEGRVYVMPATGAGALVLSLPPGFTYTGGAFGMDMTISRTISVWVAPKLALEIDFASTMTPGGANQLGLNAGYVTGSGSIEWSPDIEITLTVTDGTAETPYGFTDASGHFGSRIDIDSTADSVTVHISAIGDYDTQVDTLVKAYAEQNSVLAFICDKGGSVSLWKMNPDGSNLMQLTSLASQAENVHTVNFLQPSPDGLFLALGGRYFSDPYSYPTPYSPQSYIVNSAGTLMRIGRDLKDIFNSLQSSHKQMWVQDEAHTVLFSGYEPTRLHTPSTLFSEDASSGVRTGLGPTPYSPNSPNPDYPLNVDVFQPVSSPDGSRIAFFSGGEGTGNISVCNADGTNQHAIASLSGSGLHHLFWTSDGARVVAVLNSYASSVQVFPASGGASHEIISNAGAVYAPTMFHTANAFGYYALTGEVNYVPQGSIRYYSFEDNSVHIVMSRASAWDIAVSPNDKEIAYANMALGGDIFTVNTETGALKQLTFEDIGARQIVWYQTSH